MRAQSLCAALALSTTALPAWAAIVYEPFDYNDANSTEPNGPGGNVTDHTGFFMLGGASAPSTPTTAGRSPDGGAHTWAPVATTTIRHDQGALNASSLTVPAIMPPAVGKSYVYGGLGEGNRINTGIISTGVVYYSLMLQVGAIGAAANNQLLALNNATGASGGNVTQLLGVLLAKNGTAGNYKLGIGKNANTATFVYDESQEFSLTGGPLFVVGSYDFGAAGGTDAVARLWINPDPSSFNGPTPPAATVTSAPLSIADISNIQSFIFYQYGGSTPASGDSTRVDELRIDTSWAGVTVPEPASLVALGLSAGFFVRRRRLS